MTDHSLYNLKTSPQGYVIGKFDADLNLLAAYDVELGFCSCPAGVRPTCRHRKMLPRMIPKANTDEFYCYETNKWSQPLTGEAVTLPETETETEPTPEAKPQPAEPERPSPAPQAQAGVADLPRLPLPTSAPIIRRR